jgi:glycosyltransferase involved in cell wall biosynthesis
MQEHAEPRASVVVPAHNEEFAIRRLLSALLGGAAPGEFAVVVVCNGCTDQTAAVARSFGGDVHVVEDPRPSKREALRSGDAVARGFPRLYVDADVELGTAAARLLVEALARDGVLAAAPSRDLVRSASSCCVGAYYDIWERLPQVRTGLFGRGVIAVDRAGFDRIRQLPPVMADDLALSQAFTDDERAVVVDARVRIWLPLTLRGLIRRRIRVRTGVAQLDELTGRVAADRTSLGDLARIARREPEMIARMPVFVAVALLAKADGRRRTRAGDFDTWLRDDSRPKTAR